MKNAMFAVVGQANAGKSTLINVLVGEKISIVSPKPQTTRERILGVLHGKDYQIVFADTPGIYKQMTKLSDFMQRQIDQTVKEVDAILYVLDIHSQINQESIDLIKKYQDVGLPMVVALTKIDIMPKEELPIKFAALTQAGITAPMVPVSARRGRNINDLLNELKKVLQEGGQLFPETIISDKSEKFMVAEILREKVLLKYQKEIPHGVAIVVNQFEKRKTGNLYDINLDIVCEKPNHKAILIGKQGSALKETAAFARADMEKLLDAKVFLTVYVKVKEDWRDKGKLLQEFGYGE